MTVPAIFVHGVSASAHVETSLAPALPAVVRRGREDRLAVRGPLGAPAGHGRRDAAAPSDALLGLADDGSRCEEADGGGGEGRSGAHLAAARADHHPETAVLLLQPHATHPPHGSSSDSFSTVHDASIIGARTTTATTAAGDGVGKEISPLCEANEAQLRAALVLVANDALWTLHHPTSIGRR